MCVLTSLNFTDKVRVWDVTSGRYTERGPTPWKERANRWWTSEIDMKFWMSEIDMKFWMSEIDMKFWQKSRSCWMSEIDMKFWQKSRS